MKYVKHFAKVAKYYINRIGCKHLDTRVASCPFTGYTYTTCSKCGQRIKMEKTVG